MQLKILDAWAGLDAAAEDHAMRNRNSCAACRGELSSRLLVSEALGEWCGGSSFGVLLSLSRVAGRVLNCGPHLHSTLTTHAVVGSE